MRAKQTRNSFIDKKANIFIFVEIHYLCYVLWCCKLCFTTPQFAIYKCIGTVPSAYMREAEGKVGHEK